MSSNIKIRDEAIEKLKYGKTKFLNNNDIDLKQQGFDQFKIGLQQFLGYAKMEVNKKVQNSMKILLKEFFDDAVDMDRYLKDCQAENKKNRKQNDTLSKQRMAFVDEKPNIDWESVCGMDGVKKILQEAIVLPIKFPELFVGARSPWSGILLYGPPGTGKTYLAKACASLCNVEFFAVQASDLLSKYVGESERLVRKLFEDARLRGNSIIFIDEVDSLLSVRSSAEEQDVSKRVKTEFLVQMQGLHSKIQNNILVLGATNQPWMLDPAIRRRFEKRIYIPLPSLIAREAMFVKGLEGSRNTITELQIQQLAEYTEGYSSSDLTIILREAAYEPLRHCIRATYFKEENDQIIPCSPSHILSQKMSLQEVDPLRLELPPIDFDDFMSALSTCKPSVNLQDLDQYAQWTQEFGQES